MAGSEWQEVKRKGKGKLREGRTKGGRSRGEMEGGAGFGGRGGSGGVADLFCQSDSRTDYPVGAWLQPQAVFQMSVCAPCVWCVRFGSVCACWTLQSLGATLYQHHVVFCSPAFAFTHSRAHRQFSYFSLTRPHWRWPALLSNNDNFRLQIDQNAQLQGGILALNFPSIQPNSCHWETNSNSWNWFKLWFS